MAVTVCEEQLAAVALSVKGDDTAALLAGLLTLTPPEVTGVVAVVVADVVAVVEAGAVEAGAVEAAAEATVRATSVTHAAPAFPHAFTCSVCAPVVDVTWASIEVAFTMVVVLLLSSENPIALTGWLEQVVATAESVNCVERVAPLEGALTVALATAGIAPAASRETTRTTREIFLIIFLLGFLWVWVGVALPGAAEHGPHAAGLQPARRAVPRHGN
jgi:hypothetical protein